MVQIELLLQLELVHLIQLVVELEKMFQLLLIVEFVQKQVQAVIEPG
jgi:hypothetical protein